MIGAFFFLSFQIFKRMPLPLKGISSIFGPKIVSISFISNAAQIELYQLNKNSLYAKSRVQAQWTAHENTYGFLNQTTKLDFLPPAPFSPLLPHGNKWKYFSYATLRKNSSRGLKTPQGDLLIHRNCCWFSMINPGKLGFLPRPGRPACVIIKD